jgi:predicted PolB exonuclease-like 3'-5' exonuclease
VRLIDWRILSDPGVNTILSIMTPAVRFLVFDIESVADGSLVSRLRYPGENLTGEQAVAHYRAELMEQYDNDFIPYTYQVPASIAVAKVSGDFRLIELVVLDEPAFRPHVMTEHFWRGWEKYHRPTLVSFNGRTFDIPLLELAAFRYGLSIPTWFNLAAKSFEQPRNRYNLDAHFDLQELLTNFGSTRFTGGLNLAANLLGKPGKMDVQGHMVQDLYEAGKIAEINDYCRCDVLDTYFVFLRTRVLLGQLARDEEHEIIVDTKALLERKRGEVRAYQLYLERWGDWDDPWEG